MSERDANDGDSVDHSDVIPGTDEPEPAEVTGSEEDPAEVDDAAHEPPDPYDKYRPETLDQRLAEEEPDRAEHPTAEELELFDTADGDDAGLSEADDDDLDGGDASAEESAIHLTDKP